MYKKFKLIDKKNEFHSTTRQNNFKKIKSHQNGDTNWGLDRWDEKYKIDTHPNISVGIYNRKHWICIYGNMK